MSNAKYRLRAVPREPSADEVFNAFLGDPSAMAVQHNGPAPKMGRRVWAVVRLGAALCWRPLLWTAIGALAGAAAGFAASTWL
jgi:hypothetical protein